MKNFIKNAKDLQESQAYGQSSYEIPFDEILQTHSVTPNETVYIVDCQNSEAEFLDKKINSLTGIDSVKSGRMEILYEHVGDNHYDQLTKYIYHLLQYGTNENIQSPLVPFKDWTNCVYQTKNNKYLIKSTCAMHYDEAGALRYTLGKLTDVTGLMQAEGFRYKFTGPNCDDLWSKMNHVFDIKPFLGKREIQVLILIGKGMSSRNIATRLNISVQTVNTHRRNIIKKLETSGSINAHIKAKEMGIL